MFKVTLIVKRLKMLWHIGSIGCPAHLVQRENQFAFQLRDNKIDLSLNRELELKALVQRTTAIETDIQTMKWEHKVLSVDVDVLKDENKTHKTESGELKQKIERLEELKTKMEKVKCILIIHNFLKHSLSALIYWIEFFSNTNMWILVKVAVWTSLF